MTSVSKALSVFGGPEVEETAKFTDMFDKFFDSLDSRNCSAFYQARKFFLKQGRIQTLKKGGAYIEWGWCGHAARAAGAVFCARYNTKACRGSGGMLPQKNF